MADKLHPKDAVSPTSEKDPEIVGSRTALHKTIVGVEKPNYARLFLKKYKADSLEKAFEMKGHHAADEFLTHLANDRNFGALNPAEAGRLVGVAVRFRNAALNLIVNARYFSGLLGEEELHRILLGVVDMHKDLQEDLLRVLKEDEGRVSRVEGGERSNTEHIPNAQRLKEKVLSLWNIHPKTVLH